MTKRTGTGRSLGRWLLAAALLTSICFSQVLAADLFEEDEDNEKVIWINQLKQVGAAYEGGKKVLEFPVLTGDDETTTEPGVYLVRAKVEDYYSKKYQTPMPYSLFFNYVQRKAIHEGAVPPLPQKRAWATHGCIHVEQPYMEKLYDWAEQGSTVVIITGWRKGD